MDAFEILVIILSIFLAISILLSIIVLIYTLKLVKNIKSISDKASELVENASNVAATMKKAAGPTVVAKFVAEQIAHAIKKHSNESKKEK